MIDKITFKNYKSFKKAQDIDLKPITVLIGKNSAGKSAIAKLPTLIEASLSGDFEDPILANNNGVELGAEFRDLVYGRTIDSLILGFKENSNTLKVEVVPVAKDTDFPKIRKWEYNEEIRLTYIEKEDSYHDEISKDNYKIKFNGFNIVSVDIANIEEYIGKKFSLNTNYVGPFRELPHRTYNINGKINSKKIGIKGENTYQILINDYIRNDGKLLTKVSEWYQENFEGWGIQINDSSKPDFKIELTRKNPDFSINIRDVGEGMTQALPLVVSALLEDQTDVLTILEQPELHLHPAAHGNLAELFANSAKTSANRFLIETHSQNFVLRLRRLIAENKLSKDDLSLYSVDYNEENNTSSLNKIEVSDDGSVSSWPENVFSETLDETLAIRAAQLNKSTK